MTRQKLSDDDLSAMVEAARLYLRAVAIEDWAAVVSMLPPEVRATRESERRRVQRVLSSQTAAILAGAGAGEFLPYEEGDRTGGYLTFRARGHRTQLMVLKDRGRWRVAVLMRRLIGIQRAVDRRELADDPSAPGSSPSVREAVPAALADSRGEAEAPSTPGEPDVPAAVPLRDEALV